ncbi:MAG: hypothetical protein IKF78_06750 [Atopobiaceae bacterium]|nr:hypothetical protein [Atopobiaceae bacterium]
MGNRPGQGRKAKYQKSMRGFWQKDPSGGKRHSLSGLVYKWQHVDDPSSIPDDASIAVLGVEEEHGGDPDWRAKHWLEFHRYIADDYFVLLVEGGPLEADIMRKAEVDKRYGEKIAKGDKKDRRTKIINLTQFLDENYWCWNRRERRALRAKSIRGILAVIIKRLERAGLVVEAAYIINHNEDKREYWDFDVRAYKFELKPEHVHVLIKVKGRCKSFRGKLLAEYAEIIGVAPEFLLYPKSGGDSWDNAISYLIHAKDEKKCLYDPHDVVTLAGEDYLAIYSRRKKTWEQGRAKKAKREIREDDLDWLLDQIRSGEVKSESELILNDEYFRIYSRHEEACDRALAFYWKAHRVREAEAFANHEFTMSTLFIAGASGAGKSCLQDGLLSYFKDTYGWSVGKGAAHHTTERWKGEEVLLIDDADSDAMDATSWKHILDPYHANPLDERFRGRDACKPRVIMISSEYHPNAFFVVAAKKANQNISQFLRRAGLVTEVYMYDEYDGYNCHVTEPVEVEPFKMTTERLVNRIETAPDGTKVHEQRYERFSFERVNRRFDCPPDVVVDGEDSFMTPWAAAEIAVRRIDERNGNVIGSREDADAAFHAVWKHVADAMDNMPVEIPANYEELPPAIPASKTRPVLMAAEAERLAQEKRELETKNKRLEDARREEENRRKAEEYAASREGRIEKERKRLSALPVAERNELIIDVLDAIGPGIVRGVVRRSDVFKAAQKAYEDKRRACELVKDALGDGADTSLLDAIGEPVEPCEDDYANRIDWLNELPEKMLKAALDPQTIECIAEPEKFNYKQYGVRDFRIYDYLFHGDSYYLHWCYDEEPMDGDYITDPIVEPYTGPNESVVDDDFDPSDLYK